MNELDRKIYDRSRRDYAHRNLPTDVVDRSEALRARLGPDDYERELIFGRDGEEEIYFLNPIYARLPKDIFRIVRLPDCLGELVGPKTKWTKFAAIDWDLVAKRAGFTKRIHQKILRARFEGYSRDRLLREAREEKQRLALQAAWKQVDRKWAQVLKVLIPEKNVSPM